MRLGITLACPLCLWLWCDSASPGRIALIGDAAFAARPTAGAGTTKAVINGIDLARALHGVGSAGVARAFAEWEPEQIDIGRTLVARGIAASDNSGVASGTKSAFPSDYTIGKLAGMPPHAPTVAAAIREYQANPEAAERRTERVYLHPDKKRVLDKERQIEGCAVDSALSVILHDMAVCGRLLSRKSLIDAEHGRGCVCHCRNPTKPPPQARNSTMGFGAARLAAERGENDLARFMREPGKL